MDQRFPKGSLFGVLLGAACTLFFAAMAVVEPRHRYFSLFLVILGLTGTWRQYMVWKRHREM
ncbi:MAG: hypothetical protein H6Q05_1753 [Acidobacteria bacterium]|nr:hypothetical protein [Acidobacteriota bacterium]